MAGYAKKAEADDRSTKASIEQRMPCPLYCNLDHVAIVKRPRREHGTQQTFLGARFSSSKAWALCPWQWSRRHDGCISYLSFQRGRVVGTQIALLCSTVLFIAASKRWSLARSVQEAACNLSLCLHIMPDLCPFYAFRISSPRDGLLEYAYCIQMHALILQPRLSYRGDRPALAVWL